MVIDSQWEEERERGWKGRGRGKRLEGTRRGERLEGKRLGKGKERGISEWEREGHQALPAMTSSHMLMILSLS